MRIAVLGADGRMGRALTRAVVAAGGGAKLTAACERAGHPAIGKDAGVLAGGETLGVSVIGSLPPKGAADVWIDFTSAQATETVCKAATAAEAALVVGTTGLGPETRAAMESAARKVAVVYATNYSVGINVLRAVVAEAARALGPAYDIEIVETHHRAKRDAPSGTALTLAESVAAATGRQLETAARYARHGDVGPRTPGEIGLQAVRGGDVIGDHTVHLLGQGERIELTHRATNRDLFARGALRAARFLHGKPAGRYTMADVLHA
jgi:4-hydroxy-tetrahydrodipicolinate reductase